MIIRELTKMDAEKALELMKKLDTQTKYLRYEPGERDQTVERIRELVDIPYMTVFLAEDENSKELVAYILTFSNNWTRHKHVVELVIAVDEKYRGQGIGTMLISRAEQWAKDNNKHRIELSVNTKNEGAFSLYKRLGYELEGKKKHTSNIDGEYYDEYVMAKLI